jgi:hypothetical protein
MSPRPLQAAAAVAAAAALALTAAPAHAAADPDPLAWRELAKAYAATARYSYEPTASPAGYVRSDFCVTDGRQGGMGYHYLKAEHVGSVDPAKPAGLVYTADADGSRDLAAVEWVVKDTGQATPTLFGQAFAKDVIPGHYTLVAWIYEDNPDGMFTAVNSTAACPADAETSSAPGDPADAITLPDTGTTTPDTSTATDTSGTGTSTAAETSTAAGMPAEPGDVAVLDDLVDLDLTGLDDLVGLIGAEGLGGLLDSLL